MNTPIEFDKVLANKLHAEARQLLQVLAEEYGMTVRQAGGKFGGAEAILKFSFTINNPAAEKAQFASDCDLYGCKPADHGRRATINGKEVELFGFALGRPGFPVKCREVRGGKVVLFRQDVLAKHFRTGSN